MKVVVFTAALFLSGYVIQQRTLRDLREAIKPSPRPKAQIFLPDRFKATTTELEDGTVIVVEVDMGADAYRPPKMVQTEPVVVEVSPTVAGEEPGREDSGTGEKEGAGPDDAVDVLREGKPVEQPPDSGRQEDGEGKKKEGKTKREKKLSPAERRRQIKEEIQRLAQGNERGIYQPRLW